MEEQLDGTIAQEELQTALDEAWRREEAADPVISQTREDMQNDEGGIPAQKTEQTKAPEEQGAGTDQEPAFILKHLGITRAVDKDEVVRLAQQGMDYERVKAERDQLRAYRKQADPALTTVRDLAGMQGMSLPEYAEHCRRQGLPPARPERQEQAGRTRREEMARFLKCYPDVQPEQIPTQVWEAVKNGEALTAAYAMHRSRALEAELTAERQNRQNAQKTTGKLSTMGAGKQDEIDKWWNLEM